MFKYFFITVIIINIIIDSSSSSHSSSSNSSPIAALSNYWIQKFIVSRDIFRILWNI